MELVNEQSRADELLERYLNSPNSRSFYLDLEADNFYHYNEILCTVQMCVNGSFYLFDTLSCDLSQTFKEIIKSQELWLHGCDYDIYLLHNALQVTPGNLNDTQVAARLCGFRKFGYAPLVEQLCGIRLPKDSQRADWTQRPLSQKMIAYAMNDVRYLPQISDLLVDQLIRLKREDWFLESCQALANSYSTPKASEQKDKWRISGAGSFHPKELNFLKALYYWRDGEARKVDRPPFKIINNQQLITWSKQLAEGELVRYPKSISDGRRAKLDACIAEAESAAEESWPKRALRPRGQRIKINEDALNALILKRDKVATQLNVEGSFIASRKALEAIVKDSSEAQNLLNWQRELIQL